MHVPLDPAFVKAVLFPGLVALVYQLPLGFGAVWLLTVREGWGDTDPGKLRLFVPLVALGAALWFQLLGPVAHIRPLWLLAPAGVWVGVWGAGRCEGRERTGRCHPPHPRPLSRKRERGGPRIDSQREGRFP